MNIIIENQYFPNLNYIKCLANATHLKIEQWENFQKTSYRNRCAIFGNNGPIDLSIPVKGGREQKQLIREVEMDNSINWRNQHIRSIQSSYAKSPFFDFYFPSISGLIHSNKKFLLDLNLEILSWLIKNLKLQCTVALTEKYEKEPTEFKDMRNHFTPQRQKSIEISEAPKYLQVFEDRHGFQPNLSIIDLLFCEGPNSMRLLQTSS